MVITRNPRIFYYAAPPQDGIKLSKLEIKLLDVMKELVNASMSEILDKLKPDWRNIKKPKNGNRYTLWENVCKLGEAISLSLFMGRIMQSMERLEKIRCIKIINHN